ncbi:hypothetical protein BB561_001133 [Smittium simulii]|uniref:Uncharacterized protein n=1 Tax=Smittium simulii TaxID=133385 RepID=A0A2T9YW18_9FUNG|nr:hypothetical protein BB561_001133 [Smittium simulii]
MQITVPQQSQLAVVQYSYNNMANSSNLAYDSIILFWHSGQKEPIKAGSRQKEPIKAGSRQKEPIKAGSRQKEPIKAGTLISTLLLSSSMQTLDSEPSRHICTILTENHPPPQPSLSHSSNTKNPIHPDSESLYALQLQSFESATTNVPSISSNKINIPTYSTSLLSSPASSQKNTYLPQPSSPIPTKLYEPQNPTLSLPTESSLQPSSTDANAKKNPTFETQAKPLQGSSDLPHSSQTNCILTLPPSCSSIPSRESKHIYSLVESLDSDKNFKRVVTTTKKSRIIRAQDPQKSSNYSLSNEKNLLFDKWLLSAVKNSQKDQIAANSSFQNFELLNPSNSLDSDKKISQLSTSDINTLEHTKSLYNLLVQHHNNQLIKSSETIRSTHRFVKSSQQSSLLSKDDSNSCLKSNKRLNYADRSVSFSFPKFNKDSSRHSLQHKSLDSSNYLNFSENEKNIFFDSNDYSFSLDSLQKLDSSSTTPFKFYSDSEFTCDNIVNCDLVKKNVISDSGKSQLTHSSLNHSQPHNNDISSSNVPSKSNYLTTISRESSKINYNSFSSFNPCLKEKISITDLRLSDLSIKSNTKQSPTNSYTGHSYRTKSQNLHSTYSKKSRNYPKNSLTSLLNPKTPSNSTSAISLEKINTIRNQFTSRSHVS